MAQRQAEFACCPAIASEARNKTHVKIEADKLKPPFEIVLVDAETAKKSVEGSGGWQNFRDKYPNSPGITLVSLREQIPSIPMRFFMSGTPAIC